jgi:hypothetical protein
VWNYLQCRDTGESIQHFLLWNICYTNSL